MEFESVCSASSAQHKARVLVGITFVHYLT